MKIEYIQRSEELLDNALGKAAKQASKSTAAIRNPKARAVSKEKAKIRFAAEYLDQRLAKMARMFPTIEEMHPFQKELISISFDIKTLRENLGHVQKTGSLIKNIGNTQAKRIGRMATKKDAIAKKNQFVARASSVLKRASPSIESLRAARKEFVELPELDFSLPAILLAGFPNVGKTTLLKRLTGSEPEIAAYPFTTKGIKIGHMEYKFHEILVIDTPGLLDREYEKRNPVERKAVSALKHVAGMILFVVDPTLSCGYSLKEQVSLMKEIKNKFRGRKFLAVLNKSDIASEAEMEKAGKLVGRHVTSGEKEETDLKEQVAKVLIGK